MIRLTEKDWDSVRGNIFDAVRRLQEIENILGNTYDLDHLRELVEADKNGRCVVIPSCDKIISVIEAAVQIGEEARP